MDKQKIWSITKNFVLIVSCISGFGSMIISAIALFKNENNNIIINDLNNEINSIKAKSAYFGNTTTTGDAHFSGSIFAGPTEISEDPGSPMIDRNSNLTKNPSDGSNNMVSFGGFNGLPFAYAFAENNGQNYGMKNASIVFTTTTRPDQNNKTDLGSMEVAWKNFFVASTSFMANIEAKNSESPTTTISIGSQTNASCFILGDIDKKGLTYCTALNGTLTCSSDPCNR